MGVINAAEVWTKEKEGIKLIYEVINEEFNKNNNNIKNLKRELSKEEDEAHYLSINEKMEKVKEINLLKSRVAKAESELEELNNAKDEPYFCKLVMDEDFFISKNYCDFNKNIFLFTSKIAKLRFNKVGEPFKLANDTCSIDEKVEYKINKGNLVELTYENKSEKIKIDETNNKEIKPKEEQIPISIESLEKFFKEDYEKEESKVDTLTSIVESMKEEQDRIMRADYNGITLISGVAGSGKTNIAIHRIRYLLNEFKDNFKEEDIAIFCFNKSLKNYLLNLITELNLVKCKIFGYDEWAFGIAKDELGILGVDFKGDEGNIALFKGSKENVEIIEAFSRDILNGLLQKITSDNTLNRLFALQNRLENEKTIDAMVKELKAVINRADDKIYSAHATGKINDDNIQLYEDSKIELLNKVNEAFKENLCWNVSIDEEDYTFKLDLDGVKILKSFKEYPLYKNRLEEKGLSDSGKVSKRPTKMDLDILMNIISNISIGAINKKLYSHVLIDEVQDFTPIQVKTIYNVSNESMTICGDTTQKLYANGLNSWDNIGVDVDRKFTLRDTHRTTLETALLAREVIKNDENIEAGENVYSRGEKPLLMITSDHVNGIIDEINSIKSKEQNPSIAIVTHMKKNAGGICNALEKAGMDIYFAKGDSWDFNKKIAVSTYHQVKGLEFDYLIFLDLSNYEKKSFISGKEKIIYTTFTRAKKRLIVIDKVKPNIFNDINPGLYEERDLD